MINNNISAVQVNGGFYTVVVIKFDIWETRIIDERHFATEDEAKAFADLVNNGGKYRGEGVSCITHYIG